jgi:hypothetical protein
MALAFLPYQLLVEFTMLIHVPPTLLFIYSYMYFRIKYPRLARPFNIPGGVIAGALLSAGPTAATLVNLFYSVTDSTPTLGIPYLQAYSFLSIIGLGVIVHLGYAASDRAVDTYRSRRNNVSFADLSRET